MEIGAVCVKLAGRDADKTCVIIDEMENGFVMVDGETRRKKVNRKHLALTGKSVKVKKNAPHDEVMKALGLEATEKKAKPKKEKPSAKKTTTKAATPSKAKK